jgi:hypothetical protein
MSNRLAAAAVLALSLLAPAVPRAGDAAARRADHGG